uniref:Uncharacterized protein n=1 Tax=Arundo donax TaxID=35708 RepID=A0A0A9FQ96_ARUDO
MLTLCLHPFFCYKCPSFNLLTLYTCSRLAKKIDL